MIVANPQVINKVANKKKMMRVNKSNESERRLIKTMRSQKSIDKEIAIIGMTAINDCQRLPKKRTMSNNTHVWINEL